MQTFKEYRYERPNKEEVQSEIARLVDAFERAGSAEEQAELIQAYNKVIDRVTFLSALAEIRHDCNTLDPFYEEEKRFWDTIHPELSVSYNKYADALLSSPYKKELTERFGAALFTKYELQKKCFDETIAEDMVTENKLVSEYHKLVAVGKVEFRGESLTLNDLTPFRESVDRELRREANEAYFGYFASKAEDFDRIYDQLVAIRHKMAKKLGYENFVQMAYDRMGRSDYGPAEVAAFRDQIHRFAVPLATALREKQRARLGIDKMHYYDYALHFATGNASPKGDPDWIMARGKEMYEALGGELKDFFAFMQGSELFDVLSREGKKAGGYCSYLPTHKAPFIFANFNGTAGDVDVLTHEAGHAFQVYKTARTQVLSEYLWPTMDAAEIHSMSMEFLCWPWMELFFREDAEKYRYGHLSSAVEFLPYSALIDEFQHEVYANPELSPEERRQCFRSIEKKYLPHIDYGENSFLESGGFFFKQLHIFSVPFYYIDYSLAQLCALQFWKKSREDRERTMQVYSRLCEAGGSKTFLELLSLGELQNSFSDSVMEATLKPVADYLNSADESRF